MSRVSNYRYKNFKNDLFYKKMKSLSNIMNKDIQKLQDKVDDDQFVKELESKIRNNITYQLPNHHTNYICYNFLYKSNFVAKYKYGSNQHILMNYLWNDYDRDYIRRRRLSLQRKYNQFISTYYNTDIDNDISLFNASNLLPQDQSTVNIGNLIAQIQSEYDIERSKYQVIIVINFIWMIKIKNQIVIMK